MITWKRMGCNKLLYNQVRVKIGNTKIELLLNWIVTVDVIFSFAIFLSAMNLSNVFSSPLFTLFKGKIWKHILIEQKLLLFSNPFWLNLIFVKSIDIKIGICTKKKELLEVDTLKLYF